MYMIQMHRSKCTGMMLREHKLFLMYVMEVHMTFCTSALMMN